MGLGQREPAPRRARRRPSSPWLWDPPGALLGSQLFSKTVPFLDSAAAMFPGVARVGSVALRAPYTLGTRLRARWRRARVESSGCLGRFGFLAGEQLGELHMRAAEL